MTVGDFLGYLEKAVADGHVTLDSQVYAQHFPHDDVEYFDTDLQIWRDRVIVSAWNLPDQPWPTCIPGAIDCTSCNR